MARYLVLLYCVFISIIINVQALILATKGRFTKSFRKVHSDVNMVLTTPPRPSAVATELNSENMLKQVPSSTSQKHQGLPRSCYFERAEKCGGICPIDNRPCTATRSYFDNIYGARDPNEMCYDYIPTPKFDEKPPVVITKRRPFSFILPIEFSAMDEILPNPSQGKSWMANALVDFWKVLNRMKDAILGN